MFLSKSLLVLLVFLGVQAEASSPGLSDIWNNNQAVEYIGQDKKMEAHEEFTKLLSHSPFNPLYQFNTGVSFLGVEEVDKAIQMFEELAKNPNQIPQIEYPTFYNLGALYASKGKIDKALSYYQRALELDPQSKIVKTNIELLFQQKQGKGKGDGKNNKDNKQDQDKKDSENEKQPQEPQQFQNQPKQFKSKEMSKSDVKKILEELKKQEQKIRAKHERKGKKRDDNEKNW